MLKICKEKWNKNESKLREILKQEKDLNSCGYITLVKLAVNTILNEENNQDDELDIENITEINNGDYQGTLIYLIPFETYQPTEYEYLMTCVSYGSCSGCDTLQSIQDWCEEEITKEQLNDFMSLCKDIITNIIKPYNYGWRNNEMYDVVVE